MRPHPLARTTALMGLVFLVAAVQARKLESVQVAPATARTGEAVTVTIASDTSGGLNCGLRVHYGDGHTEDVKINQAKDATLVLQHSYAKAGSYTVMVEPKTKLPTLKCLGKNQTAQVSVSAPMAVPATPPRAAAQSTTSKPANGAPTAAGPNCPAGWTLDAKSVNKKTGAFGCKAAAGTAAPADKLACPGSLGYYENVKKGQIGCRE